MADFLILFWVTRANPFTLHVPFSPDWEMRCCLCKTPSEPYQCRIPQNKGNAQFAYHILWLITSCWPGTGNTHLKFPQMPVMDRVIFFIIILVSGSCWVNRGIKLGIHSTQTQDFFTYPIVNNHVPWNGTCSRKPSHKGGITGPLWGHLFEMEEEL